MSLSENSKSPGILDSDFSQSELLSILARMQGELEAREIAVASLKCEQRYLLYADAVCHRYFLDRGFCIDPNDAILALQRDATYVEPSNNDSLDASDPKERYQTSKDKSTPLKRIELHELIEAQKRAQEFYREQLRLAEEKYLEAYNRLEEERKKHERDTAEGDDVVAMLEKERERLQFELEHEKSQNRRLERDLKKAIDSCAEQKALTQRQRIAAANLIKERCRLLRELAQKRQEVERLERALSLRLSSSPKASSQLDDDESSPKVLSPASVSSPTSVSRSKNPSVGIQTLTESPSINRKSASFLAETTAPVSQSNSLDPDTLSINTRLNGCPESPISNSASPGDSAYSAEQKSLAAAQSSSVPTKPRPEPPLRRTPENCDPSQLGDPSVGRTVMTSIVASPYPALRALSTRTRSSLAPEPLTGPVAGSLAAKISALEVMDPGTEKRASTPSPPPPPPPPIQLHYPYPGMQGNTNHPPVPNVVSSSSPHTRHLLGSSVPHHFPASPARNRSSLSPPQQLLYSPPNHPLPPNTVPRSTTSADQSRLSLDRAPNFGLRPAPSNVLRAQVVTTTPLLTQQQSATSAVEFSYPSTPSRLDPIIDSLPKGRPTNRLSAPTHLKKETFLHSHPGGAVFPVMLVPASSGRMMATVRVGPVVTSSEGGERGGGGGDGSGNAVSHVYINGK
uniref:CTTNBP2 N-terminal-like protein n=1 Tax=Schistocephalus solidus TaxID=70667 RepID=A0A0X3Q513_SCHSO